jgi:hypothetical protein
MAGWCVRKTQEEHVRKVRSVHGDRLIVVGQYTRAHDSLLYKCVVHGEFSALPSNIEHGQRCVECARLARCNTHEEHVRRVRQQHGDKVKVVGKFVNFKTKVAYECRKHGVWDAKPGNVERGASCRKCYNERVSIRTRKSHETYATALSERELVALDRYVTSHTPIRHKCKLGHVWIAKPNVVLTGHGCPTCDKSQYRRYRVRVGAREVWLQGSEPAAVRLLIVEGTRADDLCFSTSEGKPVFEYRFKNKRHRYVPDVYDRSTNTVIEVKGPVTLGLYDRSIFSKVRAKAKAVVGHNYRLVLVYRKRLVPLPDDWLTYTRASLLNAFRNTVQQMDRRLNANRSEYVE